MVVGCLPVGVFQFKPPQSTASAGDRCSRQGTVCWSPRALLLALQDGRVLVTVLVVSVNWDKGYFKKSFMNMP